MRGTRRRAPARSTAGFCVDHERGLHTMSRENAPEVTRPCFAADGQQVRLAEIVALLLSHGRGLHVEDHAFVAQQRQIDVDAHVTDSIGARMTLEGFAQFTPADDVRSTFPLAALRDMVTSLVQAGIPPVFASVCDEFWLTYWRLQKPDVLPTACLRLERIAKQILQYAQFAAVDPAWAHFARVPLASGLSGLVFDIPA
ncbi:hypothetical protein [Burkholderia arboris]|nr:hypothetical protein [Burkholderia arboris]